MGDTTLNQAKSSGKLKLLGSSLYSRSMKDWFLLTSAREMLKAPHIANRQYE